MEENKESMFKTLFSLDVSEHTEKKQNLTYLSWAWAWAKFKSFYPNATYEVVKFENGLPYAFDPNTGYMVYTRVTVDGLTHEMWLPVMDSNNNAMLSHPYSYKTKYGTKEVQPCTMFEVNKAIMRCLTKNLAMFGLGLYIYAGEDLPESFDEGSLEFPPKALTFKEKLDDLVFHYSNWLSSDIKSMIDGAKTEDECNAMYERTLTYLKKQGAIK